DEMASYFGKNAMEEVRQGAKTLSAPMKLLESDLKSKRLVYGRNPIFEWCVTNVKVKEDTNGNIQPTKEKGKNVRIDGFAAALDAYVALERNKENYTRMIGG
ncbi:MAG TPA: terminase TerL endonuclease subunit, partial [Dysgonamonadaceae bacterium]|nr:terminase TerL endonuclease subunit [Dysgonamonadaceae bacterium]